MLSWKEATKLNQLGLARGQPALHPPSGGVRSGQVQLPAVGHGDPEEQGAGAYSRGQSWTPQEAPYPGWGHVTRGSCVALERACGHCFVVAGCVKRQWLLSLMALRFGWPLRPL